MSLQADLQAAVDRASAASQKLHAVVHGDAVSTVVTESGPVKTVARTIADNEAAISASRAELDAKVAAAAGSALAAGGAADAAAESAAMSAERAAKIPDPAPAQALRAVRVNAAGDAYELYEGGGDVVGPAGVADGALARFDGATGKLLKSGGPVATAEIADDAVTLAKLAHGTPERFLGFDAAGVPVAKDIPPVDLTSRVAKAGDTLTGTLQGPEFKTTGSSATATGFQIADGTDLAAIFMAGLQQVSSNNSNGGIPMSDRGRYPQYSGTDLHGAASREQAATWYYTTGGGNKSSGGITTPVLDRMPDGKLRLVWVTYTSYYNCDCNCMG